MRKGLFVKEASNIDVGANLLQSRGVKDEREPILGNAKQRPEPKGRLLDASYTRGHPK